MVEPRRAISSATDYDPQGDGEEGSATVSLAADGNPSRTAWGSEHYDDELWGGTKSGPNPGIGVYVTAGSPARPGKMVVRTPTRGWDAEVYAAEARDQPGRYQVEISDIELRD